MRLLKTIQLNDVHHYTQQLLQWAQSYDTFAWLDSNDYPQKYSSFDKILAVGVQSELQTNHHQAFDRLNQYQQKTQDYLFGYLSYDLKNDTENLTSNNHDELDFPDLYFFQPKIVFIFRGNILEIHYPKTFKNTIETDIKEIQNTKIQSKKKSNQLRIQSRIGEKEYLKNIEQVQNHIQRGDTYETNFCMEYYAKNSTINPLDTYLKLNDISSPPFACFFRNKEHFILSASPERFVRKENRKIISQPIKGTIKRSENSSIDKQLINQLKNDPKERSENIMIVDLVRNDLSKTASKNSVKVEELCKVYTFKQVHQLISTITSEVKKDITPVSLIKSLYPMGSMTGAPKIATMKIIEEYENNKRGIYSGSIGYFTPNGDFDFNVVIRSILHNSSKKYTSFSVGGAITSLSIPIMEYQECLLKASAMKKVLTE